MKHPKGDVLSAFRRIDTVTKKIISRSNYTKIRGFA